jgi:nucleotide-binding universal stress UspA family protein
MMTLSPSEGFGHKGFHGGLVMYRTIVVGTDCSPTADAAVAKAANLARSVGATLHVVSAYSEPVGTLVAAASGAVLPTSDWSTSAVEDRRARVEATGERLRAEGTEVVTRVEQGDPATTLIAISEEVAADLIVVGDRGLKGIRGLLGSIPNTVTHRAGIDVLVVHTT